MEQEALKKLKDLFAYDLDKVLKNYMRKSANEVKEKYKELNREERLKIFKFIVSVIDETNHEMFERHEADIRKILK